MAFLVAPPPAGDLSAAVGVSMNMKVPGVIIGDLNDDSMESVNDSDKAGGIGGMGGMGGMGM